MTRPRILVLGYGNPGRLDDGLGPALAAAIDAAAIDGVTVESSYQLGIEDAGLAAEHDVVVFADASADAPDPFEFREAPPREHHEFTTHSLAPEAVVGIARDVLGAAPRAYVLAIRGERFDGYGEELSPAAARRLGAAAGFLTGFLRRGAPAADTGEVRTCATASR